jgi:hypothetical protein
MIEMNKIEKNNKLFFILEFFFQLLLILIFIIFIFSSYLYSDVIGTIENVEGEFVYEDNDGNKQLYEELDDILLDIPYQLLNGNSVSISLLDGTFITFENKTQFKFLEFQNTDQARPIISMEVPFGIFTIETGDIPKRNKDSSNIITPVGKLILNGTLVSASLSNDQNDIYLMTDSYGNDGELLIENSSGEAQSISPNQGVRVSEQGVDNIEVSEELTTRLNDNADKIVNAAIVDDAKIEALIEKKIQAGKIADINGDGIINDEDVAQLKSNIINTKNSQVDKIINNTTSNSSLLTKVIANSSDQNSSDILEKIISAKPDITSIVVDTLVNENSDKLNAIAQSNSTAIENILTTIASNNNSNDDQLSNILSKVDQNVASNLMDKVIDNKPELLTSVITKVSASNPLKLTEIVGQNESLSNKVSATIVDQVTSSSNGTDQLKSLMKSVDGGISSNLLTQINQTNPEIVSSAIKDLVSESPEKITELLNNNITSADTSISELVVKEAIASGKQDIISDVALSIQTENPELLAVISESVQQNTQDLIDEGLIDEDSIASDQELLLTEILASPN